MATITGTSAAETLNGTGSEDFLQGLAGNDTLNGAGGNDYADYSADYLQSGGNAAGVTVNLATNTATDSFGNTDTLVSIEGAVGTGRVDTFTGSTGNNRFLGGLGADIINGGNGRDLSRYDRDAVFNGTAGIIANLSTGTIVDGFGTIDVVTGIEEVWGTVAADSFTGSQRTENFSSFGGADNFVLGGGNDFVTLHTGSSTVDGTNGFGDQVSGDNQWVSYNVNVSGVSIFATGVTVNLGTGVATKIVGTLTVTDTLIDIERVIGSSRGDILIGSDTANLRQERFRGMMGNDSIDGKAGYDMVSYSGDSNAGGTAGVTVNLATGTATDGFGNTDTLLNIEGVQGTTFADTMTGNDGDNIFMGLSGADIINGGGGTDQIELYTTDDIIGGVGATINLATGAGTYVGGSTFTFTSIERVGGSYRNDNITGSDADENFDGDFGDDIVNAGGGNDIVNAYAGADVVDGGEGTDWLSFAYDLKYPEQSAQDATAVENWSSFNWNWTGVTVNLSNTTAVNADGSTITYTNFENIAGTRKTDNLTGNAGNNVFRGFGGFDVIDGAGGSDTITFAPTYGFINGLYIQGAVGYAQSGVIINLLAGNASDSLGVLQLTSIENAIGSIGADSIEGNAEANSLAGGAGDDKLYADGGTMLMTDNALAVRRLYLATLGRGPDEGGWMDWTGQLDAGTTSVTGIAPGFVNSAEFQQKYGALDNTAFVTLLYSNVLHRAPDTGGLNDWLGRMQGGMSRAEVVVGFSESAEFKINTDQELHTAQIYRLYAATLGRQPDVGGLLGWVGALQGGGVLDNGTNTGSIGAAFVGGLEFTNKYGASLTNQQFVSLLYQNIFHREADAGGLAQWTGVLNGGASRTSVVLALSESQEHINLTTPALRSFMHTAETKWLNTLDGGAGNDNVGGGFGADTFVFNKTSVGTNDHVYSYDAWDDLKLTGFGYTTTAEALAKMTQVGDSVVFTDQGETFTLHGTKLADVNILLA